MSFSSAKKEKMIGLNSTVIQITGKNEDVFLREFSLCIKQANSLTSSDMYVGARYLHSWHTCQTIRCFSCTGLSLSEKKKVYFQAWAFEVQRTNEWWWPPCGGGSTLLYGEWLSPHQSSITVREHKFLQAAQHSNAECCFLASQEPQGLFCPFWQ